MDFFVAVVCIDLLGGNGRREIPVGNGEFIEADGTARTRGWMVSSWLCWLDVEMEKNLSGFFSPPQFIKGISLKFAAAARTPSRRP